MNRLYWISTLCAIGLLACNLALAQTTITYQGQLKQSGTPYTGTANLEFALFDQPSGGGQVGPTLVRNNWPVTDGLFQAELDFGLTAFTAQVRYLEVRVNGTPLSPRQAVRPSPMALFALDGNQGPQGDPGPPGASPFVLVGDDAIYDQGRVGVGTASPEAGLHAVSSELDPALFGQNTAASGVATGVLGRIQSFGGTAVLGIASSGTGTTYGVRGLNSSLSGQGVSGQATGASGIGADGFSQGVSGTGVRGRVTHGSGVTRAVVGEVSSPAGFGVHITGAKGSRSYFERAVGIGTDAPQADLHVAGSAQFDGTARLQQLGGQGNRLVMVNNSGQLSHAAPDLRPLVEKAMDFQVTLICEDPDNPGTTRTGAAVVNAAGTVIRELPAGLVNQVLLQSLSGQAMLYVSWPLAGCIASGSPTDSLLVGGWPEAATVFVWRVSTIGIEVQTYGRQQ